LSAPGSLATWGSGIEDLLFLAHRIPFPPDKGDKIRSYHLLRMLARQYRVRLGAFVDDPEDWKHAEAARAFAVETCLLPLRRRAPLRLLRALVRGEPLSLAFFRDGQMQRWVERSAAEGAARRVFVFSSAMAQYVLDLPPDPERQVVLDFVDVDSDKWAQYGRRRPWPASAVFAREARALLRFERRASAGSTASVFVSRAEAETFQRLAPEVAERVTWLENGVDAQYFSPDRAYSNPYGPNGAVLVFTGVMDYFANVDAVTWFTRDVFPGVRARVPEARFFIVGARPTADVLRLARSQGVSVTGRVEDVRPYLAHARAAVAPLRIARGVQNKVLEAMAMGRPVVVSPPGMEGLDWPGRYPLLADGASAWIERTCDALGSGVPADLGERLRAWVVERYSWDGKAERCIGLIEGVTAGVPSGRE